MIMANMYYEIANKMIKKVIPNLLIKFYTLIAKSKGRKCKKVKNTNVNLSNRIAVLTQEQTTWNNQIAHIRVRVESPFGLVKLILKGLKSIFFKNLVQQDYFVFIIIKVFNYVINKKYFQ
jgi:hypothetical protein